MGSPDKPIVWLPIKPISFPCLFNSYCRRGLGDLVSAGNVVAIDDFHARPLLGLTNRVDLLMICTSGVPWEGQGKLAVPCDLVGVSLSSRKEI